MKKIVIIILIILPAVVLTIFVFLSKNKSTIPDLSNIACDTDAKLCADGSVVSRSGKNCQFDPCPTGPSVSSSTPSQNSDQVKLSPPISNALSRVTKKPFGLKVSPANSPVNPEKFSGYHTGTDFETTAEEKDSEIKIFAICSGPLKLKKWATGYGGAAVQSCEINKQAVTVIYGHLLLSSIKSQPGESLNAGSQLGILGQGYSRDTDNERKHLHLAIHRGSDIVILGYVQKASDLKNWLNPLDYLQ